MPAPPTSIIYEDRQPRLVVQTAELRVVAGPDAGRAHRLSLQPTRVGSASDNDLVLSDRGVSRRHFEVRVCDRGYLVRDLDSTNGVFYRGARIREALVTTGAEIQLGDSRLRFEADSERSDVIEPRASFGGLIGRSPEIRRVYGVLAAVAPTDMTVLLEGETGTGKELVAEALHRASPRSGGLFSVVDCGAIPRELIEAELFGYEAGAFTGATGERAGVFEGSRGGTVFLDEIGEVALDQQTRLLRALDRRTTKRIGGAHMRHVDVRIVAATNRSLKECVAAGTFRSDLYYRLSVVRVRLPPLRRRKQDIAPLARHFLLQAGVPDPDSVLTPDVSAALSKRRWPGNVRELRNVVERAVALHKEDLGRGLSEEPTDVSAMRTAQPAPQHPGLEANAALPADGAWLEGVLPPAYLEHPYRSAREDLLGHFEKLYLTRLVERHGQNISKIARSARLDRHVVRRLLRKHGLYES